MKEILAAKDGRYLKIVHSIGHRSSVQLESGPNGIKSGWLMVVVAMERECGRI